MSSRPRGSEDVMDNGLEQRVERLTLGGPRYAQWLALGYLAGIFLCALVIYAEFRQIDRQIEMLVRERGSVLFHLVELKIGRAHV